AKRRGHTVKFRERKGEVSLRRIAHADSALPLAETVELGAVLRRDRPAVRVPVAPVDHRGETLVVDRKGHRGTDPGAFHPLVMVERTPFGAAVDEVVIDHKAAALADQLR